MFLDNPMKDQLNHIYASLNIRGMKKIMGLMTARLAEVFIVKSLNGRIIMRFS